MGCSSIPMKPPSTSPDGPSHRLEGALGTAAGPWPICADMGLCKGLFAYSSWAGHTQPMLMLSSGT
jgi:hypothetical protein